MGVNLWQMSMSGAVLILAVLVFRMFFLHKLPKRTFLVLWGIVALRLIIPVWFPSVFGVEAPFVQEPPLQNLFSEPQTGHGTNTEGTNDVPVPASNHAMAEKKETKQDASVPQQTERQINLSAVWNIVWGIGFLSLGLYFLVSYLRCLMEFRMAVLARNPVAAQWLQTHSGRRRIVLRQSERVHAPLTYGIFHPVILLPGNTDWGNETQLMFVLEHEYNHIRSFDMVKKLLLTMILCLHWFNPLVWVMYLLCQRDMELACDEQVVRRAGEGAKSAYAHALISMEEKRSGLMPLFGSSFSKNGMEERITAIMKIKKKTFGIVLAAAVVVLFAGMALILSMKKSAEAADYNAPNKGEVGNNDTDLPNDETEKKDNVTFGIALTDEEISKFNTEFFNGETTNMNNMLLTSEYSKPEEINLLQLFYGGIRGTASNISEEEFAALGQINEYLLHLDIIKVTTAEMDAFLKKNLGLGLEETRKKNLDDFFYFEQFDSYYLAVGDTNFDWCTVTSGVWETDGRVTLKYEKKHDAVGEWTVTLLKTEDGYLFVSNARSAKQTEHKGYFEEREPYNYAAMIRGIEGDTIIVDVVEFVTDYDVERKQQLIEELGLVEGNDLSDGNFLDGYYIYNKDTITTEWKLTPDTVYRFIDWNQHFTTVPDEITPNYYTRRYTTTLAEEFRLDIEDGYGYDSPMPFFFLVEDGVVLSVYEPFIP